MKVLLLANNLVGLNVARQLRESDDEVVGLTVHPPQTAKYRREIVDLFDLPADRILVGAEINEPAAHRRIKGWGPEVLLCAFFGYILKPETLRLAPRGVINLHNSLLPYNRGSFANAWTLLNRSPAGVTIHLMDAGVDSGPILDRRPVPCDLKDTAETLYRKCETALDELFRSVWPRFKAGQIVPQPQSHLHPTSTHRKRDVERIDEIDLDRTYRGRDLIDLLRARTFPPYPGAYIREGGRKIYLRLQLLDESEL